jgi:superfamily II DNA or RNA helicase
MSLILDIEELSNEEREKINDDMTIKIENKMSFIPPRSFYLAEILNDKIYLPFAYSVNILNKKRKLRKEFSEMNIEFAGTLRDEQKIVKKEALEHLNKTGSVIISAHTGFGKSISSLNIAYTIKLKTLIIVNKIVLINQWKESIERFCPDATIQKVTTKSKLQDCDFYIMNAINVKKMGQIFFKDIGTVICDEIHLLMAESLSKSLHFLSPRYLIGLSATPYRPDGLDVLLELYFGKNKIIRKMNRKHIVFQVNTGFIPKVETTSTGKVNWGVILKSQSEDEDRNNLIIKIIKQFSKRNFLVLTKRVEQANILVSKLKEIDESVTSLIGKEQEYDKEARILVAISQKCSTGFDHPKMDTLILCSDVEQYFIQSLGRIFRKKESTPIVFDLLDNNPILLKHFRTRKEVYKENGGIVKDFFKEFPEFLN